MNVVIINDGLKTSKNKSDRVLSKFLPNIGRHVYAGPITLEGLKALRDLLSESASKNTSVSCFKVLSRDNLSLEWTVGNHRNYNENGDFAFKYATNQICVDPITNELAEFRAVIVQFAVLAGLLHDIGKGFFYFQNKLSFKPIDKEAKAAFRGGDPIRHEKMSFNLLAHEFAMQDKSEDLITYLERLKNYFETFSYKAERPHFHEKTQASLSPIIRGLKSKGGSFLSPVLQLVLSHHRLTENSDLQQLIKTYHHDESGHFAKKYYELYGKQRFILEDSDIQKSIVNAFQRIIDTFNNSENKDALINKLTDKPLIDRVTQYILRPSFILADQHYSSINLNDKRSAPCQDDTPIANTIDGQYNQTLKEHLLGVSKVASSSSRYLFNLAFLNKKRYLPFIETAPAQFQKKTPMRLYEQFGWQTESQLSIREALKNQEGDFGFIGFLMAKTGAGKTTGNAKILSELSGHRNIRFTCLLGMKSLTLQTFDEYKSFLAIKNTQIQGVIGSSHTRTLHDINNDEEKSSVDEAEMEEQSIELQGGFKAENKPMPSFLQFSKRETKLSKIIESPVLVCTIDYMISGFSSNRSNKSKYLVRLLDSDLIIDEIDSYSNQQMISILKLVHLCGLYGNKVLLSSATLSENLIEQLQTAYETGYKQYCLVKDISNPIYTGLYTHELKSIQTGLLKDVDVKAFVAKFKKTLIDTSTKIKIDVLNIPDRASLREAYGDIYKKSLQQHEGLKKPLDEVNFSTGLIKLANIKHVIGFAKELLDGRFNIPEHILLKIEVYHSKNLEIKKSFQEFKLKKFLTRKDDRKLVETGEFQSLKREAIKKGKTDVLILVIGSPIIETGRDFDFDFIITEPRDHRSLIQTGGRNYRHRNQAPPRPSFCVVNRSMKYFDENNTSRYYAWPGFEGQALSKKTKQNAPITDAFEDLFEFKNGDYLSAACVLQSTPDKGQTFKLAKKMEICSAEIFKKHDYSFSEFLKKSSQVLTNNAAKALPFRENTGFNTDTKLMLNANHEIDFDYEGLSQESVPIKFNRTSYKLGEFILLKETLIEIIEHYGFNIETYFDREVILTHSKNSEEFNEYIGTL